MIKKTGKPFRDQVADMRRITRTLPRHIGTEAVVFAKRSFDRQGFFDESFKPWKPLNSKSLSKRHQKKGRKALLLTGRLKRSIRITYISDGIVAVGTDVPYAQLHNEGGTIRKNVLIKAHKRKVTRAFGKKLKQAKTSTIKAHRRNMKLTVPQRQYLGQSKFFDKRITMQIEYKIKQALGIR
jgi:phage gpG-like protein